MPRTQHPSELADRILSSPNLPPIIKYNKELYAYEPDNGIYSLIDDDDLDQFIHDFALVNGIITDLNPTLSSNIRWFMLLSKRIKKVKTMNDHENIINLKNGLINLDEKLAPGQPFTLIPHDPSYHFTSKVNIPYDPTQKSAPYFISCLESIFRKLPHDRTPKSPTYDEETVLSIIRLGGYILYPQNKIKKMFIFYGQGANGKSIIMERVYKMFFTKDNMSALSLNSLSSESSFARHKLLTSRVNFATEQKAGDIESEELKKIISGETISVDRKNKDWIDFEPNCKVIIAANRLPYFKDTTHGTDRRLHIIYFPNRFVPPAEYKKEEDPESRGLYPAQNEEEMVDKLTEEAPAILNLFLEALQDLRKNNWYFPPTKNSIMVKEEYKEESDPIGTWLKDNYKRAGMDEFGIVTVRDLMISYEEWNMYTHSNSKGKGLTSIFMTKKIKEVFGIKPFRYQSKDPITGRYTSMSAFKLSSRTPASIEEIVLQ